MGWDLWKVGGREGGRMRGDEEKAMRRAKLRRPGIHRKDRE